MSKGRHERARRSFLQHPSLSTLLPALRGDVTLRAAALEALRRARAAVGRRRERAFLTRATGDVGPARLRPESARLGPERRLAEFRERPAPRLLPGLEEAGGDEFRRALHERFVDERLKIIEEAEAIVGPEELPGAGRWPLLGFGVLDFDRLDWRRDPVSGARWELEYHADLRLVRGDGGDVRVVWELNRLGHLVTLGRAYAATGDERFARKLLRQARYWRVNNPVGFGPNWACAMEVALRAMNLLAALKLVRRSPSLDEGHFSELLAMFDEHGEHIRRNLEFSHIATSNHYLSDVAGLFWLGTALPELEAARGWREWALRELLSEMGKQVLPDGAHWEASTGYHRFVTELFLYSFMLARENGIHVEETHWLRLRSMLDYVRAYLRPDGRAPLIGDTDGGRVLPVSRRTADEHAYLLAVGAVVFDEPRFAVHRRAPEEALWLLGAEGVRKYDALAAKATASASEAPPAAGAPVEGPRAFRDAGTYVLGEGDLYLLFNASGAGMRGRGSHGHNDALSVEVSAGGSCFLRDPGTFVYTGDLHERHLFRSTRYHSTVEVDGEEQNTTDERAPFRIGDEARPSLVRWEESPDHVLAVAGHTGYERLSGGPVSHTRSVLFDRRARLWRIEDALEGRGRHTFRFFFHLAPGLEAEARADASVAVCDRITGARLNIVPLWRGCGAPSLEPRRSSRDYGYAEASLAACWSVEAQAPLFARWALVPLRADETEERLEAEGRKQ
ncbi:MAG TPA: alginate lyase family protein [Pyrinomonadaceae bacterium]|nr:alginate lyase family protein [Pyrinomonadaceae bacterium]